MVEEAKKTDTSTKTQLSLAAALFFAPLVHYILCSSQRNISESDTTFISGYIKLWYLNLILWILTILTGSIQYFFIVSRSHTLYIVCIAILITLLMISMVCILADISLLPWRTFWWTAQPITGNKKDIILKFLPLYNIYLRYDAHAFTTPNRRIKESLLWWTALALVSMTWIVWLTTLLILCIILRVAALMLDIDFLPLGVKNKLNMVFTKNPEELRWYVVWSLLYVFHGIQALIMRTPAPSFRSDIVYAKDLYSGIVDIHAPHHLIVREYIVGSILLIIWIFTLPFIPTLWTYYVWGVLILSRYILMATIRKHLPHLPVAREIVAFISRIISHFTHHSLTSNEK